MPVTGHSEYCPFANTHQKIRLDGYDDTAVAVRGAKIVGAEYVQYPGKRWDIHRHGVESTRCALRPGVIYHDVHRSDMEFG